MLKPEGRNDKSFDVMLRFIENFYRMHQCFDYTYIHSKGCGKMVR